MDRLYFGVEERHFIPIVWFYIILGTILSIILFIDKNDQTITFYAMILVLWFCYLVTMAMTSRLEAKVKKK